MKVKASQSEHFLEGSGEALHIDPHHYIVDVDTMASGSDLQLMRRPEDENLVVLLQRGSSRGLKTLLRIECSWP